MVDNAQRWYFVDRAKASLENARRADDPAVTAVHMELYRRYRERAGKLAARLIVPDDGADATFAPN